MNTNTHIDYERQSPNGKTPHRWQYTKDSVMDSPALLPRKRANGLGASMSRVCMRWNYTDIMHVIRIQHPINGMRLLVGKCRQIC